MKIHSEAVRHTRDILPVALIVILIMTALPGMAQQTTGVPGSPSATTTIDGKQLPAPDPKFGGLIKENAAQSTPWWPPTACWTARSTSLNGPRR